MPDVILAETRADIEEALGFLTQHAKRQQCIVERFSSDVPTAWTKAHEAINLALSQWEQAPA